MRSDAMLCACAALYCDGGSRGYTMSRNLVKDKVQNRIDSAWLT